MTKPHRPADDEIVVLVERDQKHPLYWRFTIRYGRDHAAAAPLRRRRGSWPDMSASGLSLYEQTVGHVPLPEPVVMSSLRWHHADLSSDSSTMTLSWRLPASAPN